MHKFIKDVISSLTTQLERLQSKRIKKRILININIFNLIYFFIVQDDDGIKLAATFSKFSTDFTNGFNPKGDNANMTEFSKCISDISAMTRSVYATHDKTLVNKII